MRRLSVLASLLCTSFSPALAEVNVVTDIPVVQSLVAEVLGDDSQPSVIVEAGADPHSYQMRPSQARALSNAELVIWLGPDLTVWLDRVLDGSDAPQLVLLDVPGTHLREFGDEHDHGDHDDHGSEEHAEEDHDDHGHEDHAEAKHDDHDEHDHGSDAIDPHAWLDPENAPIWLDAIAAKLSELDAANADRYAANAAAASSRIEGTITELQEKMHDADLHPIVVFHDAYGYLSEAFDFEVAGSIALGDATAPGAKHLIELREHIERDGVECIFREPQHSPKLAEQIADEAGLEIGTLDPLGVRIEAGPMYYERLMAALVDDLVSCSSHKG